MATGTEQTPQQTLINHRWDFKDDERKIYDYIFDVAVAMTRSGDPVDHQTGALLMRIINDWEKNPRSVSTPVVSDAYDLAKGWQDRAQFLDTVLSDVNVEELLDLPDFYSS